MTVNTRREKVETALHTIDRLEDYLRGHEKEIRWCNINFIGTAKPTFLSFKENRDSAMTFEIVPFLRRTIEKFGYTNVDAHISFEDRDYLKSNIDEGCLTGWQLWDGERIGASFEEIRADKRLSSIHPTVLANEYLLAELKPKADDIVKVNMTAGPPNHEKRLYYRKDIPGHSVESVFEFITNMTTFTKVGTGRVTLKSGNYYTSHRPMQTFLAYWKYWDYELI